LYGCETWSLTLKEEHRLRVFENRLQRKVFGSRRSNRKFDKIACEQLQALYSSPNIINVLKARRVGWAGHVARME
jgi:hypothetical protein